jgi:hypothetical protein
MYVRCAERLHALVVKQSSKDLACRIDAEEIVQSVFRTFFRRAAHGHYTIPEGGEIWKLLLVIALNKVRAAGAYHCAVKRDMRQTVRGEAFEQAMESEQSRDEGPLTVLRMVIDEVLTPTGSTITFPVVVIFTANGQFTSGQFTWKETNPLTGQVTTVLATYTVGPMFPVAGEPFYLTMVLQGEIVFQGIYAQPGPGEFIIETFDTWPLVGGPDFFSFFRQ